MLPRALGRQPLRNGMRAALFAIAALSFVSSTRAGAADPADWVRPA